MKGVLTTVLAGVIVGTLMACWVPIFNSVTVICLILICVRETLSLRT